MAKRRHYARKHHVIGEPVPWLPIDSRIIPHIFSFGHVKGVAKLFLQIEMILSIGVVLGTLVIVLLKVF